MTIISQQGVEANLMSRDAIVVFGLLLVVVIALLIAILIDVDAERGCKSWFIDSQRKAMCDLGITEDDVNRRFAGMVPKD